MIHLDLFSGIGGFALAVEQSIEITDHIFVEYDPFCQLVLKKHWPNAHIHGDIKTFTKRIVLNAIRDEHRADERPLSTKKKISSISGETVDARRSLRTAFILTGGFPCQPFSQAGRREGTNDDRYLWPEMFRVIRDWKPTWVIAENVRGLATWNDGMVLEQVCSDLESEGYEVQPLIIPAVALNAPHRRDRIWFVAHRRGKKSGRLSNKSRKEGAEIGRKNRDASNSSSERIGRRTSKECGVHEWELVEKKQKGSKVWGQGQGRIGVNRHKHISSHAVSINAQGMRKEQDGQAPNRLSNRKDTGWNKDWLEVATRLCRVDDGLPRRMDRNPRLKALGNAIVPQVAMQIIKAIIFLGK